MRRSYTPPDRAFTVLELLITVAVLLALAATVLPTLARRPNYLRINCINNLKQIGLAFKTWAVDNNDMVPMQVSVTNGGTMELIKDGNVWPHFVVMSNELSTPRVVFCPEENDPHRKVADGFAAQPAPDSRNDAGHYLPLTNDSSLNYFVGVDAQNTYPNMLLSGDINLRIDGQPVGHGLRSVWTNSAVAWRKPKHNGEGNILFVDGSVERLATFRWPFVLRATGVATNVLAIP
jgi:prepilin-type processing-associated H-X9-DG protein